MLLSDGKITHIEGGQSVTEGSVFPLFRPLALCPGVRRKAWDWWLANILRCSPENKGSQSAK